MCVCVSVYCGVKYPSDSSLLYIDQLREAGHPSPSPSKPEYVRMACHCLDV